MALLITEFGNGKRTRVLLADDGHDQICRDKPSYSPPLQGPKRFYRLPERERLAL